MHDFPRKVVKTNDLRAKYSKQKVCRVKFRGPRRDWRLAERLTADIVPPKNGQEARAISQRLFAWSKFNMLQRFRGSKNKRSKSGAVPSLYQSDKLAPFALFHRYTAN
jgi:hypothetical protein